jgi:hypothetical protein
MLATLSFLSPNATRSEYSDRLAGGLEESLIAAFEKEVVRMEPTFLNQLDGFSTMRQCCSILKA